MELLTSFDAPRIDELLKREDFFWLDLDPADPKAVEAASKHLNLPGASIVAPHRGRDPRASLRRHENCVELRLLFAGPGNEGRLIDAGPVSMWVSGDWVVTITHDECEELVELRNAEAGIGASEELLVFRVLDAIAQSYSDSLDRVDVFVEGLIDGIIERPRGGQRDAVLEAKRRLVRLRNVAASQQNVYTRAYAEITDLGSEGLQFGQRDLLIKAADQMNQVSDRIDSTRNLLGSALDSYDASISERLTIVATIFLPLTVLTAFFGENFKWMTDRIGGLDDFLIWGVGAFLAIVGITVALAVRAGYMKLPGMRRPRLPLPPRRT